MTSLSVHGANAQTSPARFVTVDQGADELKADEVLAHGLGRQLIGNPEQLSYEAVIIALLDDARGDKPLARTGGVVARVTPYAFVVAELPGSEGRAARHLSQGSTGRTNTNAFMVVESPFGGATPTTL